MLLCCRYRLHLQILAVVMSGVSWFICTNSCLISGIDEIFTACSVSLIKQQKVLA